MTEVRRVEWPFWETPEWSDPAMFQQGIAGALELFFRAWMPFQALVADVTGHPVPVFQRVDQAGYRLPLDERVLADTDTLVERAGRFRAAAVVIDVAMRPRSP